MGSTTDKPRKDFLNLTFVGIDELDMFPSELERQKALDSIGKSVKPWELVIGIVLVAGAIAINFGLKDLIRWLLPDTGRMTREILEIVRFLFVFGSAFVVLRMFHRWGVKHDLRVKLEAYRPKVRNQLAGISSTVLGFAI